jgi:phosphatidylglycerophosphate synthase
VTLTRATLVGGVAALTVDSFDRHAPVEVLVTLAVVALVLDAVDGQVARRTGTATAFGARFDMEVDASLILVLSVYVTRPIGGWALTIGVMRYAFVVATWVLPWMRGSLPSRYWRKVVAATQGVVLVFATADALPRPLTAAALAASLALLIESFGRDVRWLWHHRLRGGRPPLSAKPEVVAARAETVRDRSDNGGQSPPDRGLPDTLGERCELPAQSGSTTLGGPSPARWAAHFPTRDDTPRCARGSGPWCEEMRT